MSEDILKKIVDKRRADIERLGLTFGFDIPEKRTVGRCEFLGRPGPILEVKRASPPRGTLPRIWFLLIWHALMPLLAHRQFPF